LERVQVELRFSVPSRVHFGLLQMSGRYSTVNMGVGGALTRPCWILEATASRRNEITSEFELDDDLRSSAVVVMDRLAERLGERMRVSVVEAVPAHAGLGSKTSLLCGLTAAACELAGTSEKWLEYRYLTGRGGTSGIGINTSASGGIILDSGHVENDEQRLFAPSRLRAGRPIPEVVSRWPAADWPMLVVTPREASRFHGVVENNLLRDATPLPAGEVERNAAVVLYELLPALALGSYGMFTRAVSELQHVGLKRRQWEAQSPLVRRTRERLLALGADCVALSSMGPSMLVLTTSPLEIDTALGDTCDVLTTSFKDSGIEVV
jgi:beta-ribofuranosylaminobenzene 5'-phosphate synthase